jgi:hypothetical protein
MSKILLCHSTKLLSQLCQPLFLLFLHTKIPKDNSLPLAFFLFFYLRHFPLCTFFTKFIYLFTILSWAPPFSSVCMVIFTTFDCHILLLMINQAFLAIQVHEERNNSSTCMFETKVLNPSLGSG